MDISIHVSQKENTISSSLFSRNELAEIIKEGITGTEKMLFGIEKHQCWA